MNFDVTLFRYAVGFFLGLGVGVLITDRKWRVVFEGYHERIRQVIKLHDCGTARRGGWTMQDEAAPFLEPPHRLQ